MTAPAFTAAFRLAGPTQSWGTASPYIRKDTLPYPTLSGVLGLLRAAYGIGRSADIAEWNWMLDLDMAIRIDRSGHPQTDFHTINQRPKLLPPDALFADKEHQYQVTVGSGTGWSVPNPELPNTYVNYSTMLTYRTYLHDAVFTLLLGASFDRLTEILQVVDNPFWQLSLGRKACVPDYPLGLGLQNVPLLEAASTVPAYLPGTRRIPDTTFDATVHILHDSSATIEGTLPPVTHADVPTGSHPFHPRTQLTRQRLTVAAPVTDDAGLLEWRSQHHPAHQISSSTH